MMTSHSLVSLARQFQATYHRSFHKRLGQHLLIDKNMLNKLVRAVAPQSEEQVIEIGAGLGFLTAPLAAVSRHLSAVEIDSECTAFAQQYLKELGYRDVQWIEEDFLTLDYPDCFLGGYFSADRSGGLSQPFVVVGNLPYSVSSPILFHLFEKPPYPRRLILMFQKEVAERLVATPGTKAYGFLSVWVQYHAVVKRLFTVPKNCFFPIPQVDSEVVMLVPRPPLLPAVEMKARFFAMVSAAFGKRRKTLASALHQGTTFQVDRSVVQAALRKLHLNEKVRAETLSLEVLMQLFSQFTMP